MTAARKLPRYPYADLAPFIEAAYKPDPDTFNFSRATKAMIVLGVCRNTVINWQDRGMPERAADHMAVRLGYHPASIWPTWWEGAA